MAAAGIISSPRTSPRPNGLLLVTIREARSYRLETIWKEKADPFGFEGGVAALVDDQERAPGQPDELVFELAQVVGSGALVGFDGIVAAVDPWQVEASPPLIVIDLGSQACARPLHQEIRPRTQRRRLGAIELDGQQLGSASTPTHRPGVTQILGAPDDYWLSPASCDYAPSSKIAQASSPLTSCIRGNNLCVIEVITSMLFGARPIQPTKHQLTQLLERSAVGIKMGGTANSFNESTSENCWVLVIVRMEVLGSDLRAVQDILDCMTPDRRP